MDIPIDGVNRISVFIRSADKSIIRDVGSTSIGSTSLRLIVPTVSFETFEHLLDQPSSELQAVGPVSAHLFSLDGCIHSGSYVKYAFH